MTNKIEANSQVGYKLLLGRILFCPDIRLIPNPVSGWISRQHQITKYPALEISRISGIQIVSISSIRPDIENSRYPARDSA